MKQKAEDRMKRSQPCVSKVVKVRIRWTLLRVQRGRQTGRVMLFLMQAVSLHSILLAQRAKRLQYPHLLHQVSWGTDGFLYLAHRSCDQARVGF